MVASYVERNTNLAGTDYQLQGQRFVVNYTFVAVADMVDRSLWTAPAACRLVAISEVHTTAEAAGTVAIVPTRQQSTEAPAAGDVLVTGGFTGTGAAETVQAGTVVTAANANVFAANNRLGIDFTGDIAGELAGVTVSALFEWV